jgi:molybdopterin synthase sulfur carrier subunit
MGQSGSEVARPHQVHAESRDLSARPVRAVLLLFASARQAAGRSREDVEGVTVGDVLDQARRRHGDGFTQVLDASRVWVNGETAGPDTVLVDGDEIAVLPPVSGGG